MKQEKINRINQLAKKKKTAGLTKEELLEQRELYREYINEFRANLKSELDNLIIENPDGTTIDLKELKKAKRGNKL